MPADAPYRVLYTRPESTHAFERLLRLEGIEVVRIPLIRIAAPASWDALDAALNDIDAWDGVILTSAQAARWFAGRMMDCGIDERRLPPVHAVGPKTAAAAKDAGLRPLELPSEFYGSVLAEEMQAVAGKRYLQPTSDIARDELVQVLRRRGAEVQQVQAYRTLPATDADIARLRAAADAGFDCVAFFSPSAVRQFASALPQWRQGQVRIAAIGATTAGEADRAGLRVDVVAATQTAEALAEAIIAARHHQPDPLTP